MQLQVDYIIATYLHSGDAIHRPAVAHIGSETMFMSLQQWGRRDVFLITSHYLTCPAKAATSLASEHACTHI